MLGRSIGDMHADMHAEALMPVRANMTLNDSATESACDDQSHEAGAGQHLHFLMFI